MVKYVCAVCGFIYDPAVGSPESGVPALTAWEDVPEDWVCPVCGAGKGEFEAQAAPGKEKREPVLAAPEAAGELNAVEKSALCLNLSRGCEKQYKPQEAALFRELADWFKASAQPARTPDFSQLQSLVEGDLDLVFPSVNAVAKAEADRGAMRALVWSEKVTRMLKSLLNRERKEAGSFEAANVYVCTICGFIYTGNSLPEVCPVCKVPNWKFEKVEGRQ